MNRTLMHNITSPVGGVRRRGNVMLFVIFILGTLFAASMAFLALMRTEAGVMSSRSNQAKLDVIFGGLSDDLVLSSARSLMGQGLALTGGRRVPYVQDAVDNDGPDGIPASAGSTDDDGIADRSDSLSSIATIPGVHHLVASIEPYDPGTGVLEWFAVSDPYRAWDDRADVHANPINSALPVEPSLPATRPLRIRPLNGIGLLPPYDYITDATDDRFTRNWGLSDADGDGVGDSVRYRVALLGGGEADWGVPDPSDNDDVDCDGVMVMDAPFTGAPSFTTTNPLMRTPLPCDDPGLDGFAPGTAYPQSLRRAIAAKLRDPDENIVDDFDDLYFSLRVIQNGGMANLDYSHRTLIDNLFGLAEDGTPVAGKMMKLPYGPAVEQALRRRGVLAPLRWNDPLATLGPLGEDMLADDGRDGSLYKTLFEALIVPQTGPPEDLQWFPVLDEPGGITPEDVYDLDWAGRWMNPDRWNDLNDSAGVGNVERHYDIAHLLTDVSTDDVLMRNGMYDPDGPGGPIAPVLLTNLTFPALPSPSPYDPGSDPTDPLPHTSRHPTLNPDGDSALDMYPAYDPTWALTGDPTLSDRSFIDLQGLPTVPLRLQTQQNGDAFFGAARDGNGNVSDPRFGKMQFALHSIGNINNPTRREIQTVQDYFTVMLRNVKNAAGFPNCTGTIDQCIHDQAAQLTANFIDFADYDPLTPGGGVGVNPGLPTTDLPTRVISRSGKIYYGIEKQPYISEVYYDAATLEYAIELFNPHPAVSIDLARAGSRYSIWVNDASTVLVDFSVNDNNVIPPQGIVYISTSGNVYSGPGLRSPQMLNTAGLTMNNGDRILLVRKFNPLTDIHCDEVTIGPPGAGGPWTGGSFQRDNVPNNMGGWRATVPRYHFGPGPDGDYGTPDDPVHPDDTLAQTIGAFNTGVQLKAPIVPVHATTDDLGLESAYPTTGSLLLLMRYANTTTAAANTVLGQSMPPLDNGHMPVFDLGQVAQGAANGPQPMDGTTLLSIPWGQLVFDYFTALPFDNQFNPLADPPAFTIPTFAGDTGDPDWLTNPNGDADGDGLPARMDRGHAEYVAYLRSNQPTVELGGVRVHGRININAAPWKVIDGLPLMPPQVMPIYKHLYWHTGPPPIPTIDQWKWSNVLPDPNGGFPMGFDSFTPTGDGAGMAGPPVEKLGVGKAKGIVAYRELRELWNPAGDWNTGDYNTLNGGFRLRQDGSGTVNFLANTTQRHTAGFLTVGELANVRQSGIVGFARRQFNDEFSQMDNGQSLVFTGAGVQNYLFAVAPLVALGDWVTVKGHTFTAYGVLTGHGKVVSDNPDDEVVLDRAERFEMVFDRSNLLISDDPAERPEVIYKLREPLSEANPN